VLCDSELEVGGLTCSHEFCCLCACSFAVSQPCQSAWLCSSQPAHFPPDSIACLPSLHRCPPPPWRPASSTGRSCLPGWRQRSSSA
jgi:hypothetical protein